jgi:ribonucleoside-diphosphate reductase subunit M1
VWEIKQRVLVDMAADRGAYIDQSQSFNVHISDPNFGKLTSLHFHAWRSGLKTGMYYLRTRAAADAIKFTVDQQMASESKAKAVANGTEGKGAPPAATARAEAEAAMLCSLNNRDACLSCGS